MNQRVHWPRPSVCVSVCRSLAVFLHYCTDPDVTLGNSRGCPLVVQQWADLQSVHEFRCYDNSDNIDVRIQHYRSTVQCKRMSIDVTSISIIPSQVNPNPILTTRSQFEQKLAPNAKFYRVFGLALLTGRNMQVLQARRKIQGIQRRGNTECHRCQSCVQLTMSKYCKELKSLISARKIIPSIQ